MSGRQEKIIFALSIILWILASFGGESTYTQEITKIENQQQHTLSTEEKSSLKLKHSYIGQLGRTIEPILQPLGYDWKMGIALISSFAAREVFVGTLSVVYSVGEGEEDAKSLRQRLSLAKREGSTELLFTPAVCLSLLIFYAFAMQCMSTLAVTYRETGTWRWPLLQLTYMNLLAYLAALCVYTLLK